MTRAPLLLVRADAGRAIGTGHVMRGLALAQAWQDAGGEARFALAPHAEPMAARLAAEGMTVMPVRGGGGADDAADTTELARRLGAHWVAVDGYGFGRGYQAEVRRSGAGVLCVDDGARVDGYAADVILDQTLDADPATYAHAPSGTRLLLGTEYALLRREFRQWAGPARVEPAAATRVLVTVGGSDPLNASSALLRGLATLGRSGLVVRVVVGPANPWLVELRSLAAALPLAVSLCTAVTDMPGLMRWAHIALTGAGTTCWELLRMGVPMLTLTVADNQEGIAAALAAAGVAVHLGGHAALGSDAGASRAAERIALVLDDVTLRQRLAERGRSLVDGHGAERVVEHLTSALVATR